MLAGVAALVSLAGYGIYRAFAMGELLLGTVALAFALTLGGIVLACMCE
jgi:hypothetical protein